jgi:hypothetical protein
MINHVDVISRYADARSRIDTGGRCPAMPSYLTALALPLRAPHDAAGQPAGGPRARFAQRGWLALRERLHA